MSNLETFAVWQDINFKKCFDAFGYKGKTIAECYQALSKIGWFYPYNTFYNLYMGKRRVTIEHAYFMTILFNKSIGELINVSREGEQDDERTM